MALYYNMDVNTFYSLRLSEVIDFIEVKSKRDENINNMNFLFFGQVCATIANFSINKPKNKKFKAKDFFKIKSEKKKRQNPEQMAKILEGFTLAMGGELN